MARGMCQFEVTTISELKLCSRAHRLVSSALPKVLSAERSRSMQQVKNLESSGVSRAISRALVSRCTPLISSRLPRSAASSSMASGMRAAAPVSATMPSALRSRVTSSDGMVNTNQQNPAPSSTAPAVPADMVKKPITRARLVSMLVNRIQGPVHGMPRGHRRHQRDQHDLAEHGDIAGNADRERSEQGRGLLSPRGAYEPAADEAGEREQYDRAAAANGAALQAEPQKMPLETAGDEAVLGADEMQNLNHWLVGRHRATGREGDREHGGGDHQEQNRDAGGNRGSCHGAHAIDPAAMIVEHCSRHLLGQHLSQLRNVGRGAARDLDHDQARHRQFVELEPVAEPRFE